MLWLKILNNFHILYQGRKTPKFTTHTAFIFYTKIVDLAVKHGKHNYYFQNYKHQWILCHLSTSPCNLCVTPSWRSQFPSYLIVCDVQIFPIVNYTKFNILSVGVWFRYMYTICIFYYHDYCQIRNFWKIFFLNTSNWTRIPISLNWLYHFIITCQVAWVYCPKNIFGYRILCIRSH